MNEVDSDYITYWNNATFEDHVRGLKTAINAKEYKRAAYLLKKIKQHPKFNKTPNVFMNIVVREVNIADKLLTALGY